MKTFYFIALYCISSYSIANNFDCNNYKSQNNKCIALHNNNSFLSAFPLDESKNKYEWNFTKNHPEYSCKTELGFCRNGSFIANEYNYILFSSNINGFGRESEGTLEKLIKNKNSHTTLERSSRLAGEEDININKNPIIKALILPEGAVAVYSDDLTTKNYYLKTIQLMQN